MSQKFPDSKNISQDAPTPAPSESEEPEESQEDKEEQETQGSDVTTAENEAESTTEYDSMGEEESGPVCFKSTEEWQADLLRRVIVVQDNIRYQVAALLGPMTANRRSLLRRAQYHLMLLEKIVSQVSLEKGDENTTSDTLFRSERNLNRIGWIVYRGRNGWYFYDCCYQSLDTSEEQIETMCGQKADSDTLTPRI